jgi:dihydrofolate reductase
MDGGSVESSIRSDTSGRSGGLLAAAFSLNPTTITTYSRLGFSYRGARVRRIINSTFITLDGVIGNPHQWPSGRLTDDASVAMQTNLLFSCDAVLMGRNTYNNFAAAWPARSGDPFSDRLNSMAKYVVSTTLTNAEWQNTTIIGHDPLGQIARMKNEPGRDIVQYGFGQLSYALMERRLLDELRLWVHPVFLGRGGPEGLLYRDAPTTMFTFVDAQPFKNGNVVLTYRLP